MKILHIVEDYSLSSGGLRTVIKDLNENLNKSQINSYILSAKEEKGDAIFIQETDKPWLYSKMWSVKIEELHKKFNFDLFHIHAVWMFPQYIAAKFCIRNNIPFLVSFHGMYEPWLWEKGTFKKKLYFNLLTKKLFSRAVYLHAITEDESDNIKKIFNKKNIIIIPNLISNKTFSNFIVEKSSEKYILFLGRLDEKKGIDILLKSFSKLNDKDIKIKIAGKINEYKKVLDIIIQKLEITHLVEFLGMVTKKDKEILIQNAFVLVTPSHSEVIGMVNLEAAILKTPVITTYQTGLNIEWNDNGGILINPNVKELENALREVLGWTVLQRNINGEKLYKFVSENYSWDKRIEDWKQFYKNSIKNHYRPIKLS